MAQAEQRTGPPRQLDTRLSVRRSWAAALKLVEPSASWGSPRRQNAVLRDLSDGGCGLLAQRFVYPGTICTILGSQPQAACDGRRGRVVRCRYLPGTAALYELGIQFASV